MSFTIESLDGEWKALLETGKKYRLGSDQRTADFSFPNDTQLSPLHLMLEPLAYDLRLRDLGSTNGTLLNGRRIWDASASSGDWITAGGLILRLQGLLADEAAQELPEQEAEAEWERIARRVATILREHPHPLFAVLDAAREPAILDLLKSSPMIRCQSLFAGEKGASLAAVAPYLVEVERRGRWLEDLTDAAWSRSWGVFLSSALDFDGLRRHLRRFLLAKGPGNKQYYFRYYDPRVLRSFLPACNAEELKAFFGPVQSYFAEGETAESGVRFTLAGASCKSEPFQLKGA